MVFANSGPTDSTFTLPVWRSSGTGTAFVTTTSSMDEFAMRSYAGPLNRPCVAHAYTFSAPFALSVVAAATSEPAVSIMSSFRMHTLPCTLPMSAVISAWLCFGRSLCMMAMSQSSCSISLK